jgi:hypothetical protein
LISPKPYLKIILLWFFILSVFGFLLAVSAAGPGGASAIFFFIAMTLGLALGAIHISIISIVRGSKAQRFLIPIISLTLLLIIYVNHENGIMNGYKTMEGASDYKYIIKDKKMVVMPTIVSFDTAKKYIIGLQLYVQEFTCEVKSRTHYSIKLTSRKKYFVLDTELDEQVGFDNKNAFSQKLRQLDIEADIELDYAAFDKVWINHKGYSNETDFSNCTESNA